MNLNLGRDRCCTLPFKRDIIGSQGDQGNFGQLGEIGLTGSTGATGFQGATGLCYRGYKGPQGARGNQGGPTGPQGAIGPVGTTGPGESSSLNFSFTTQELTTYYSDYTDLTAFPGASPSYNIYLSNNTYAISWSIYESWSDPYCNFAVRFKDSFNNYHYPYVFRANFPDPPGYLNTPCVLNTDSSKTFGSGNDLFISTINTNYSIELIQKTNGSRIFIPSDSTVNFSITFVPMS